MTITVPKAPWRAAAAATALHTCRMNRKRYLLLPHSKTAIDNRQSKIANHSYLSATMASTFVARRAGT
jgi:hypothetical protein